LGPFQVKSGDELENLDLVLSRGFTGRVRLMNKTQTPIGQANVRAAVSLGTDSSGMTIPLNRVQADEDGWLRIEHVHDRPVVLKVRAPGYRTAERAFTLQPEQPVEWTLEAARPATGRVVSADNGMPVAKAELVLVSALRRTASGTHSYGGNDPRVPGSDEPPLATTKDDGHLVLDTLEDDLEDLP
jgi:hypothetical protein